MSDILPSFNRQAVEPIECLKSGFALIKDQYWFFFGITAVGMLIAALVPLAILVGPMMCGLYLVLFERMRNRPVEFSLLFRGFEYFMESLLATLLVIAPILLLLIPFYALFLVGFLGFVHGQQRGGNPPEPAVVAAFVIGFSLFVVVLMAIGLVIRVLFAFAYQLIVDRKLSAMQAIKISIRASMANFWRLLALVLLNGALSMVGVLCCYVGAFLVMPVTVAANAMAYRQVFGLSANQPPAPAPAPIT